MEFDGGKSMDRAKGPGRCGMSGLIHVESGQVGCRDAADAKRAHGDPDGARDGLVRAQLPDLKLKRPRRKIKKLELVGNGQS